jgi:hypothetical protein
MPKMTIAFFASVLAFASSTAIAGDLPDYGSKNFTPSDGTPTHFANEDLPVSARTADTTERDWSAVDAMAPARPVGRSRWAYHGAGRHGRYAVAHGSGRHTAGGSAGGTYGTRSLPVRYHPTAPGTVKTMSAKHGRPGARHASAAAHDSAM